MNCCLESIRTATVCFCATACSFYWTETCNIVDPPGLLLVLLLSRFQSLHKEWKWESGAKTKSFPVVWQECEGILSCFFLSVFFFFFRRRGRQRAQKPTPTNTWPFSPCVCTCALFKRAAHHSRFQRCLCLCERREDHVPLSRAARREGGVKKVHGEFFAAELQARDWRNQTMGPAATSPLALALCLCSLSLCGPAGAASTSPTQVGTTQWLLYGGETLARFSSGHTAAPNVAAPLQ